MIRNIGWPALLAAASLASPVCPAQEGRISVSAAVERVSGDYGGDISLDDLYVPLNVVYERGRVAFRATIPYLEVEFIDPVDSTTYTESGLGDVLLGVTFYDAARSRNGAWFVDVTTKVELGTADESRGLGYGETDLIVLVDAFRRLDGGMFIASAGYKLRSAPAGIDLDDTWLFSLGGVRRFTSRTSGSIFLDHRQSAIPGLDAIQEMIISVTQRLENDWQARLHFAQGLSDTSIDSAVGITVQKSF